MEVLVFLCPLTYSERLMPYGGIDLGHHWLSDSTKPSFEPMLTYHQQGPMTSTWGQFHKRYLRHKSINLALKNYSPIISFALPLRPRQNGRYFADDIFKYIFLNENAWISLKISLKFVPEVLIDNIPALVQIMAWRRARWQAIIWTNDGYFTDAHICATRPHWRCWWPQLTFF